MRVDTAAQFRDALLCRPILHVPNAQWCAGPFTLDAAIANGAATSVDLTTQDAWFGDLQVRQAYACVDASTVKLKALVHIEAVELLILEGAISKLDLDTKDNLTITATAPYLEANVAGTVRKIGLYGAMTELHELVQVTQAAAADGERGYLRGRPIQLGSPIRIDLENDTFTLKSDADVALGVAAAVKVKLHGFVIPGTVGVSGVIPGASCGATAGEGDTGPAAMQRQIAGFATWNGLLANIAR
jgi:hypothetical protein